MMNHDMLSVLSCLTLLGFLNSPAGPEQQMSDTRKKPLKAGQDVEIFPLVLPVYSAMPSSVYFGNIMQWEQIQ